MIKVVDGNLLNASEVLIGHQTNCMGRMGAGIALQIAHSYPNVEAEYKKLCAAHSPKSLFGFFQLVRISDTRVVANLFGQINPGKPYGEDSLKERYNALHFALYNMRLWGERERWSMALPYGLACGLAGGNWPTVYAMIKEVFENSEVTLYKYRR